VIGNSTDAIAFAVDAASGRRKIGMERGADRGGEMRKAVFG